MNSAPNSTVGRIRQPGKLRGYLRAVGAVVWKDLLAEYRSRELLGAMLVFALLVILIFNFALELDIRTRETVASGVLWVTFAFAGTLELNRSLSLEMENDCLDGLFLAPMEHSAIYFGKVLGNLIFISAIEALMLPIFSVLFEVNLIQNIIGIFQNKMRHSLTPFLSLSLLFLAGPTEITEFSKFKGG